MLFKTILSTCGFKFYSFKGEIVYSAIKNTLEVVSWQLNPFYLILFLVEINDEKLNEAKQGIF